MENRYQEYYDKNTKTHEVRTFQYDGHLQKHWSYDNLKILSGQYRFYCSSGLVSSRYQVNDIVDGEMLEYDL